MERVPEDAGARNEATLQPTLPCASEVALKTPPGWEEKEVNTCTLLSMKSSNNEHMYKHFHMIEETNLTVTSNSKTMESWVTEKLLVQLYETKSQT